MIDKKTSYLPFPVLFIGVFIANVAVLCFPLFQDTLHEGHDFLFHFGRFAGLVDGLENGVFQVRMNYTFFFGGGYGSPLFYPDFFMFPFAALAALGLGVVGALNLFMISITAATFLVSAYSFNGMIKSKYGALIGAVLYTSADYFARVLYTRAALGEMLVFVFLPLLLYALYNLFFEKFTKPALLIISLCGLVLSHEIFAALSALMCLFLAIIGIPYFIKNPKILLKMLLCVFITLVLTAFFWVPMLEQTFTDSFMLVDAYHAIPEKETVPLDEMFILPNLRNFGFRILVFLPLRLLFIRKKPDKRLLRIADVSMVFGLFFLFMSTSLFPWHFFSSVLNYIQFPWRLYLPAVLCLSISACVLITLVSNFPKIAPHADFLRFPVFAIQIIPAFILVLNIFHPMSPPAEWLSDKHSLYPNTGFEYFRSDRSMADTLFFTYHAVAEDANDKAMPVTREYNVLRISLDRTTDSVRVPFIYYLGYEATYNIPDQPPVRLPIDCDDTLEIVRVRTAGLVPGGTIFVRYDGTTAQHVSFGVSAAAALGISVLTVILHFRKKRGTSVPRPHAPDCSSVV